MCRNFSNKENSEHITVKSLATRIVVANALDSLDLDNVEQLIDHMAAKRPDNLTCTTQRPTGLRNNAKGTPLQKQAIIEWLDHCSKGAKELLQSSLWDVLANPVIQTSQLNVLINNLPSYISHRLFKNDSTARKPLRAVTQIKGIAFKNSVDALSALLLLARENFILDRHRLTIELYFFSQALLCRLAIQPAIGAFMRELTTLVDQFFQHNCLANPHQTEKPDHATHILATYLERRTTISILKNAATVQLYRCYLKQSKFRKVSNDNNHMSNIHLLNSIDDSERRAFNMILDYIHDSLSSPSSCLRQCTESQPATSYTKMKRSRR